MRHGQRTKATRVSVPVLVGAFCGSLLVGFGVGAEELQIHACVKENAEGNVRIVEDPGDCRLNERLVTWNIQGPPGPPGGGAVVHYAEQSADATAQVVSEWIDLVGAEVTFTTDDTATLDLFANGAMSTRFGTASFVRCGLRFVVDGVPTGEPTFGEMLVSPARNESGGGEWMSFTLTRRVGVGPGQHVVGVQLAKVPSNVATDLACAIDERDYSGVRLYVTVG